MSRSRRRSHARRACEGQERPFGTMVLPAGTRRADIERWTGQAVAPATAPAIDSRLVAQRPLELARTSPVFDLGYRYGELARGVDQSQHEDPVVQPALDVYRDTPITAAPNDGCEPDGKT